ncbi:MAG TPA: class II fructose-bisphosphatase [Acidimicrobiia bacterium]|nr:class II fructose-bisphosphatase [Acidimicrobiia bacterium]
MQDDDLGVATLSPGSGDGGRRETARPRPDRNLGLELVRVTEAAALAAARLMGRGEGEVAEQAAIAAMRLLMDTVPMDGVVAIGEGEKDSASVLFTGESIGRGEGPAVDIAVRAVDGRRLAARGMNGALSAAALAERGSMFDPGPCRYMDKIAVGPEAAGVIDIAAPVAENLRRIAAATSRSLADLTVIVLDRPRHDALVAEIREAGARVKFILAGDIGGAITAARRGTGVDVLLGVGGTSEGVLAAAAIKCLGGAIQARLVPSSDEERALARAAGYDLDRVLTTDDLVSGRDVFFAATGITSGDLLEGVRYDGEITITQSLAMRSRSGTVRRIESEHRREKLKQYSAIEY